MSLQPTTDEVQKYTCRRPECDGFTEYHRFQHTIKISKAVRLEADYDGPYRLHVDGITFEGAEIDLLTHDLKTAAALAADLNRGDQDRTEFIAGNVRGALSMAFRRSNSTPLREILDASPQRARDIYAGRASMTADELGAVSAFFGVDDPLAWFTVSRPWLRIVGTLHGDEANGDWIAGARDRLVTYREEQAA